MIFTRCICYFPWYSLIFQGIRVETQYTTVWLSDEIIEFGIVRYLIQELNENPRTQDLKNSKTQLKLSQHNSRTQKDFKNFSKNSSNLW